MATYNSEIYKEQTHPVVGGVITSLLSRNAQPNIVSGEIQYAIIPYATAGTEDEATQDVINLCVLPAGAIPLPELSYVLCEDPGGALTLDVGTSIDPDGWGDNLDLANGGKIEFGPIAAQPAWMSTRTALPADSNSGNAIVYATVVLGTTVTVGKKLLFILAYKRGK